MAAAKRDDDKDKENGHPLLAEAVKLRMKSPRVTRDTLAGALNRNRSYVDRLLNGRQAETLAVWQQIGRYLTMEQSTIAELHLRDELVKRAADQFEDYEALLSGRLPETSDDWNTCLRGLISTRPPLGQMASLLHDCLPLREHAERNDVVSMKLVTYLWARTLQDHNQRALAREYYTAASAMKPADEELDISIVLSQANLCTEAGRPLGGIGYYQALEPLQARFTDRQRAFWSLFSSEARIAARLFSPWGDASELQTTFERDFESSLSACQAYGSRWWVKRAELWLSFVRGESLLASIDRKEWNKAVRFKESAALSAITDYWSLHGALAIWQTAHDTTERDVRRLVQRGDHGLAYHLLTSAQRPKW